MLSGPHSSFYHPPLSPVLTLLLVVMLARLLFFGLRRRGAGFRWRRGRSRCSLSERQRSDSWWPSELREDSDGRSKSASTSEDHKPFETRRADVLRLFEQELLELQEHGLKLRSARDKDELEQFVAERQARSRT
jgi:hypothetical protein